MVARYFFDAEERVFSVVEEPEFFRLTIARERIGPQHVEDFCDTSVEWLSSNPDKGILVDFKGVKSVSGDFIVQLFRYYEEVKARGLYVRFVNVDPALENYLTPSNITVVLTPEMLLPEKPHLSARAILRDLAANMRDAEIMRKYGLSEKGLRSMFRKLLRKGLITRRALARRWGMETADIHLLEQGAKPRKVKKVDAKEVRKDIARDLSDQELMGKYRLSRRGLQSMMRKLYEQGLISDEILARRKKLSKRT
jgi:predicted DNA-binding transcriptional regulator/anti-anti-sigma regulatory factor